MKKYNYKPLFLATLLAIGLFSCSKDEDTSATVMGIGGDIFPKQALDGWLDSTFTKPYNIEVKYRWDQNEIPDKVLVPPLVDNVKPVMLAVKNIWIDPYVAEAGGDFVKKFCPKQYVLVGSPDYNSDGTITLGTAEGGRKVVLYDVNRFTSKNPEVVKFTLHVIHHEFTHILTQNIAYDVNYKSITKGLYTAQWYNVSDDEALEQGFITPYSMNTPDEDFAEMVATMLTQGKTNFDATVNAIVDPVGKANIRKKEQIVINYFKQAYNIDFRKLQTRTQDAIVAFSK